MNKTSEWNRSFHGVGIKLDPQVAHVANDFVLDVYLQTDPKNCMRLAKHIRRAYRIRYQEELKISAGSLAIEIYGHYKVQKTAVKAEGLAGKNKVTGWLLGHTDVIDCGSREKDNNRIVWDSLEMLHKMPSAFSAKLPGRR